MEIVLAVTLIATLLAASTAVPGGAPSTPQPTRRTDGPASRPPDDRSIQPIAGGEDPDIQ